MLSALSLALADAGDGPGATARAAAALQHAEAFSTRAAGALEQGRAAAREVIAAVASDSSWRSATDVTSVRR